ncbi:hypothetical protein DFP72DRAFT_1069354 [Ephemerocybe angulata]|uniref:Uncharacterized protein n=1 Tax=Ephemerocybe angulata TaxID=980116 RepID=A0A8H6M522_9AGAR|nr:hypothetical protein DFP72DRAFT_1069354 [Tulosesus angulatus]
MEDNNDQESVTEPSSCDLDGRRYSEMSNPPSHYIPKTPKPSLNAPNGLDQADQESVTEPSSCDLDGRRYSDMTNPPSHYIPKTPKPTLVNLPGAFGPLTMEENDEKARQWLENRLEAPTSSPGFFGHKPAEIFEFPDDVYARQASPNTAAEYKKRAACSYMEQEARYAEEGFDELSDFVPETDETEDLEVEAAITASWEVAPSTSLALASPRTVYKAKAAKAQALCNKEIEECKYQIEELRRRLEFQEAKLTNAVYKKRRIEMHLKRVAPMLEKSDD